MIRLHKGAKPEVLVQNAGQWTAELLAQLQRGENGTATRLHRYSHPEIKSALVTETHRKCAYCESKPLHVAHGDVEHIQPKSIQPELAFEWSNLTLACSKCNGAKSNQEGFIDPYVIEPADELGFFGPMALHKPDKAVAERTIGTLQLNRIDLLERRAARLKTITNQIGRLATTSDPEHRDFLTKEIEEHETSDDKEFAACVRDFVAASKRDGYF